MHLYDCNFLFIFVCPSIFADLYFDISHWAFLLIFLDGLLKAWWHKNNAGTAIIKTETNRFHTENMCVHSHSIVTMAAILSSRLEICALALTLRIGRFPRPKSGPRFLIKSNFVFVIVDVYFHQRLASQSNFLSNDNDERLHNNFLLCEEMVMSEEKLVAFSITGADILRCVHTIRLTTLNRRYAFNVDSASMCLSNCRPASSRCEMIATLAN